ncbi:chromate efflux transporter [Labilibacter sediminis]|nr:chromate efflux transporter [Labilibacter sediminis]
MNKEVSLKYLFLTFLKIGATSWGGFMALISVVQKNLVEKDKVIKDDEILDGISLASVLPGPVAFNVVSYIGYRLKGLKGAFVSMAAITLPSFILILILAHAYIQYGELSVFTNFFKGILPAITAIIISVAFNMAKKNIKDYKQLIIALAAIIALMLFRSFFITAIIISVGALSGYFLYRHSSEKKKETNTPQPKINKTKIIQYSALTVIFFVVIIYLPLIAKGNLHEQVQIQRDILLTFSGLSVTLFGGGYVIIPAIHEVIVEGLHWLNTKEFADAIAMGQVTPGPIFISATFIGYKVGGLIGAITATLAIFLPPAAIMLICSHFMNSIKNSKTVMAIFKGLRPAVIGMIFAAAYTIGKDITINWATIFIFISTLVLSLKFKINVVYLIPLAGITGVLIISFL